MPAKYSLLILIDMNTIEIKGSVEAYKKADEARGAVSVVTGAQAIKSMSEYFIKQHQGGDDPGLHTGDVVEIPPLPDEGKPVDTDERWICSSYTSKTGGTNVNVSVVATVTRQGIEMLTRVFLGSFFNSKIDADGKRYPYMMTFTNGARTAWSFCGQTRGELWKKLAGRKFKVTRNTIVNEVRRDYGSNENKIIPRGCWFEFVES